MVYEEAKATKPVYENQLSQFTENLKNSSMESVSLKMGDLKTPESIQDKVVRDGDAPREIKDYLRSTIVTDDVNDLKKIHDAIHDEFKVVKFKDNHANPTSTGLRNYNFKVEMPNGHVAEVQIMHSSIWDVKDESHAYYKQAQKIDELGLLTPEQEALQRSYYDKAFDSQNTPAVEAGLNKLLDPNMSPEIRAKYGFKPALDTPKLSKTFNPAASLPDGGLEAHMRPDMVPDRMTGGMRTGASGFGVGAGGYYAYQSYKQGDVGGVVLGSSNMIVSGADMVVDAAQMMGKSFAPAMGSTLMKSNVGLMVADSAYQVYKEEGNFIDEDGGLGHKGERAIAATGTASTALGGGMLLGGGSAAGGTLLATASAAAAPIILTGAAVVATAKFGDTMIEYSRLKDSMDKDAAEATAPLKFAQSEDGIPSLSNYKQSMFSAVKYSHEMRDDQMNGIILRDEENGRITNFKHIDWTDPQNLAEFETMLDNQIARQQEILQENSSILPDLLRDTESIDQEYFATMDLMMLEGAREELASFKAELAVYKTMSVPDHAVDLTAVFNGLPNAISEGMPPEVQALVEVKTNEDLFEKQFEELKEHGGLTAVEEYMAANPIDPEAAIVLEFSPTIQPTHASDMKL